MARDTVNFNQLSAASSTLNRVTSSTPSWVAGTINAPGTVLLVNPNGIEITKSGVVNTGSFAASTLNIKDSDYLSGKYTFNGNGGSAAVINSGRINVSDGGFVTVSGGQVANNGIISARLGSVGLGAGEQATLDLSGDGFLSVAVPSSELDNLVNANGALVSNNGKILANGGTVFLSAATASNILKNAVNIPPSPHQYGWRAQRQDRHQWRCWRHGLGHRQARCEWWQEFWRGGSIAIAGKSVTAADRQARGQWGERWHGLIVGGDQATLNGLLTAKGKSGKGGEIDLTAGNVTLTGATIDASGATGGGTVNIGGGPHATTALADAQSLSIDAASTINASATTTGDGGHIVVWSDGLTTALGTFSATGGANGGNGGLVETSGQTVNFDGLRVNTSAAQGTFGTWLVDPADLIIDTNAANTISGNLANTSVTTSGAGNIDVNAQIAWNSGQTLTLTAGAALNVNAEINIENDGGKLILNTGS